MAGHAPRSPIEYLSPALHHVFIETAKVFNNPANTAPQAVTNTNARIRGSIPTAIDRFQLALDALEIEVLRAKAIFRRDLEVLRQRTEEEAKANAEQETEEARIRTLAEKDTVKKRREQEEKETKEKATADQP